MTGMKRTFSPDSIMKFSTRQEKEASFSLTEVKWKENERFSVTVMIDERPFLTGVTGKRMFVYRSVIHNP